MKIFASLLSASLMLAGLALLSPGALCVSAEEPKEAEKPTYKLFIHTGRGPEHGTRANIYLTLVGETAKSKEIHVNPLMKEKSFEPGSNVAIEFAVAESLGRIKTVVVRSDMSGESPDWLLQYVVTEDPEGKSETVDFNALINNKEPRSGRRAGGGR